MIEIKYLSGDSETVNFDLYLLVPNGNNNAGISWLQAIALSRLYNVQNVDDVNYIIINMDYTFSTPGLSPSEKLTALQDHHNTLLTTIPNEIRNRLMFSGYQII